MCLCNFGTLFVQWHQHVHSLQFGSVLVSIAMQFVYVLLQVVILGSGSLWLLLISQFLFIPQIALQPLSQKT